LAEVGIKSGGSWLLAFRRVYASIESCQTVTEPGGLEVVNGPMVGCRDILSVYRDEIELISSVWIGPS
jgi:hypothetical protein